MGTDWGYIMDLAQIITLILGVLAILAAVIKDQPFRPYSSERLAELAEDIKANGQISPCTVRKKDEKYIILAGRNRKKACQIAGVKVSCIVIECDDPTANLILVNSNLNQRQELLPSEKAFAYKL
ncbi:ParB/RepB/Spo0J family partition protein [Caproicibacter fermentans]|uniref:ParB N-terminal domain-containing protein n=1 Tax=Caproicibacter fermentans TaxID=2576756 RepID=A0A7G8TD39_9FIRM|nr:ParB N-terminal domain-containing protein [Caproicibacter fermentans]QNK41530.1 ParB N-terminal domain-containing protein [Caproicibacter fermentans]